MAKVCPSTTAAIPLDLTALNSAFLCRRNAWLTNTHNLLIDNSDPRRSFQ
jgi:hypothetical protein